MKITVTTPEASKTPTGIFAKMREADAKKNVDHLGTSVMLSGEYATDCRGEKTSMKVGETVYLNNSIFNELFGNRLMVHADTIVVDGWYPYQESLDLVAKKVVVNSKLRGRVINITAQEVVLTEQVCAQTCVIVTMAVPGEAESSHKLNASMVKSENFNHLKVGEVPEEELAELAELISQPQTVNRNAAIVKWLTKRLSAQAKKLNLEADFVGNKISEALESLADELVSSEQVNDVDVDTSDVNIEDIFAKPSVPGTDPNAPQVQATEAAEEQAAAVSSGAEKPEEAVQQAAAPRARRGRRVILNGEETITTPSAVSVPAAGGQTPVIIPAIKVELDESDGGGMPSSNSPEKNLQ
jgi:hypothetical protein